MSEEKKCWQGWDGGRPHPCLCDRKERHNPPHVCSCGETK